MKKLSVSAIALVLCAIIFVLSGCDVSVDLNKEESTVPEPDTAVVEITNAQGTVIATENVTMSPEDKAQSETFFNKSENKVDAGINQDRLDEALKTETTKKPATSNKDNGDKVNGDKDSNEDLGALEATSKVNEILPDGDGAILRSNQYLANVRIKAEGETTSYKIARKNGKSSFTFVYEGKNIGLIITEDKIYMLSIDEKEYVEFPKETVSEHATAEEMELLNKNVFDFERKIVKTKNERLKGTVYTVYIYEDGTKDYYLNGKIMQTVSEDGTTMYYDSVSAIAPSNLFAPPADYTKAKLEESTAVVSSDVQ